MGDVISFELPLVHTEMPCGHIIYTTQGFMDLRRKDHGHFFCTACGMDCTWNSPEQPKAPAPPPRPSLGERVTKLFKS